jgi:hypothetical protein
MGPGFVAAYNISESGLLTDPVSRSKTAGTILFNPVIPGPAETVFVKCFTRGWRRLKTLQLWKSCTKQFNKNSAT